MAKIYGLFGSMTGKLAETVMSVRNGEQIARKYQPVVFNPSTPAQVAQRAKLKLMSQVSAVMAPVIAFRRKGSVSSRNLFTKANLGKTTYANNEADVALDTIDLTGGIIALPRISYSREENGILVGFQSSVVPVDVNRVVYALFVRENDNRLRYIKTEIADEAGLGNDWPATMPLVNNGVILAYGVRDNTENARTLFSNLSVEDATYVGKIITSSSLTESDITLSETRGIIVTAPAP